MWDNTLNIESKSYKRIWVLKRLKNMGCSLNELTMVYTRLVRSVCEFAVTYWGTMICGKESSRIERIQKTALHVILGNEFGSYSAALSRTKLVRLDIRRAKLISNFAVKSAKNGKFAEWFRKNTGQNRTTRLIQPTYREEFIRTERYRKSPVPYYTEVLNGLQNEVSTSEKLQCEKCGLNFETSTNLNDHMRYKHGGYSGPIWSNKVM